METKIYRRYRVHPFFGADILINITAVGYRVSAYNEIDFIGEDGRVIASIHPHRWVMVIDLDAEISFTKVEEE